MSERNGPWGHLKSDLRRGARKALSRLFGNSQPVDAGPHRVAFDGGPAGEVAAGQTLLQAAQQLGLDLDHYCGGTCSCGTCRVEILDGASALSPISPREAMVLGDSRARAGDRLACQAKVQGPVRLRRPRFA